MNYHLSININVYLKKKTIFLFLMKIMYFVKCKNYIIKMFLVFEETIDFTMNGVCLFLSADSLLKRMFG